MVGFQPFVLYWKPLSFLKTFGGKRHLFPQNSFKSTVQNELCVPRAIICSESGVFDDFLSKYVHQLPENSHFHFCFALQNLSKHVQESLLDFPLCRSQKPWKVGKGAKIKIPLQKSTISSNTALDILTVLNTPINMLFNSGGPPISRNAHPPLFRDSLFLVFCEFSGFLRFL